VGPRAGLKVLKKKEYSLTPNEIRTLYCLARSLASVPTREYPRLRI